MKAATRVERAALADAVAAYSAFKPPKRVTVSEGAAQALYLRQPGGYTGPWSADETPYMAEPMNMLASKRHEAVVFVGPARTGKCLDVDTPIPTPDGWVRMGDLKCGDFVFGPDGRATKVLQAHAEKHDLVCYRVEFSDGSSLVADSEHLWGVERFYWKAPSWRYEVKTTAEILSDLYYGKKANGKKRFRYRVRNTAAIDLPEADLLIDPYLLGVWLGDGSSSQASVSSHKDDAAHYVRHFLAQGHAVSVVDDAKNTVSLLIDLRERLTTHCQRGHAFAEVGQAKNGGCMECLRRGHHKRKHGKPMEPLSLFANTFSSKLHALGVHGNKHIPAQYLRSSKAQRTALLRGLMDTDGGFDRRAGCVEYTTVLPVLADNVRELARSLGFKPVKRQKRTSWTYKGVRKEGSAYRVTFPADGDINPFLLPRKAGNVVFAKADVNYRQIVAITPVASRPVRCILVDNDSHLFLAGEGMVPTHNTLGLLDGWVSYAVTCDPGDMLIVQMSQDKAREYSKTRVARALRHSPALAALMSPSGNDDNTHDKMFRNGMFLKIGWPTATQLSGSDYRYVGFTDYDRMPDDIDGEGAPYGLGLKRTQTFLSRGMCMVESSPGRPITDPGWRPTTPHEGPPCTGVVGIYNRSDRRRWYWPCPDCGDYFEAAPGLDLFHLPEEKELLELVRESDLHALASQYERVVCPHCGTLIGKEHKHPMNRRGVWLADGQTITAEGEIIGEAQRASIAGYWLGGVAAAYQSWHSLVLRYLQGLKEYALTGSELSLQNTVNTDQGLPYLSRLLAANAAGRRGPESRKDESLHRFIAPEWTRFVLASVDVQGGQSARFVVQVHAIGEHLEQAPIDRFAITESRRRGVDGGYAPIDPAAYEEDWDQIREMVLNATYRTEEDGREIQVKATVVDTGGEDGVTEKAYAWYRRLRSEGLEGKVMLLKGASTPNAPLIKESWVGQPRHGEKGDIPLYLINTNIFKDGVTASLKREVPGAGYFHIPSWLPKAFFDELNAEVRDARGRWSKVRKRNEAFDLAAYIRALCVRLRADRPEFWENPPAWAWPLDTNPLVITREQRRKVHESAAEAPQVLRRRSTRSSYLG